MHSNKGEKFILWFDELGVEDVPLVGGKNASLGEMYGNLAEKGVKVPGGFAITAYTYRYLIEKSGIKNKISEILSDLDTYDFENLAEHGEKIRNAILDTEIPEDLKKAIAEAYRKLCEEYGHNTDVAVRSSATAEDLPDASFAGQQESFLNVRGEDALVEACKRCFASLFTNRAISYRVDKGFDHLSVYLSIGVQKMIRSDLACAGVAFSIDTETGFENVILINASYGLGENVVKGRVIPDEYYVFKSTLKQGKRPILSKKLGTKPIKMIYDSKGTVDVAVSDEDRNKFVLSDDEVLELAKWVYIIEDHYGKPMDVEWAKDGITGEIYIVQARPETVHSQKSKTKTEIYKLKSRGDVLVKGTSIGEKIGQGEVNLIRSVNDLKDFKEGQVLVTEMTDPAWEPIMKIASAIVTDRGGRTCHAAIIGRELGIPCVVGTIDGTKVLSTGEEVTICCAEGEEGVVYEGLLDYEVEKLDIDTIPKTRTKIMMNVGIPERAFELSFIPNDGIGLAREEFIINSHIKIHPLALLNYDKLEDAELIKEIDSLTSGYDDKRQYFVDKLARGIARIAAAFYPNDVIVRLSDFKSNEYANLIGGSLYEPKEDNPMLGWRGASRYYAGEYMDAFALECIALKKVREEMGLTNVKVMVPFCRTVEEGKRVLDEMRRSGLVQGENGLEVYMMCEIPSNVILADQFAEIFDGFSIGSNDLTQLTLGLDRDSELVSHIYDERNEAVKRLIRDVIAVVREKGKKIGICGQAPSDFPDFAQFLVECGIDSISLNPDTVIKTRLKIAEAENKNR
jgi:pyruvate,water dikinase